MTIAFTPQEFQFVQQFTNEMFQTAVLRDGPMGDMVTRIRNQFLVEGPVTLAAADQGFLLFAINDVYNTSHSSIVKSQLGLQMQFLRPTLKPHVNSDISDAGMVSGKFSRAGFSGTFSTMWEVMTSVMTKLGMSAPPPAPALPTGVTGQGDSGGISHPEVHDIDDGTGYNDR